jgi:uncharacterized cupredoxin-like copper-binding protein
MIRLFVLVGIAGGLVIAYLATFAVGPISQLPPSQSLLTGFRAKGVVPASVNLEEDETAEESGVFEVPPQDKTMLKQIMAKAASMPAMKMEGEAKTPMKMEGEGEMKPATEDGNAAIVSDELKLGEGGLIFYEDGQFDREISLDMDEWKFSNMKIDVKAGERIKFTVKNKGQIPHEFMFMNTPLMSSVAYRATRADWSLIEHVALFEKALVLPGGEFTFVLKVNQPGAWRFMCMLPYHMQMGMMGQMSTPGMASDMAM